MSDTRFALRLPTVSQKTAFQCLGWRPTRRANPLSTLRGYAVFELPSSLVFHEVTVCSSGRAHWVAMPARLAMTPDYFPHGVGTNARWETLISFRGREARKQFSDLAISALLTTVPDALDPDSTARAWSAEEGYGDL